jgi:hypothetical protein
LYNKNTHRTKHELLHPLSGVNETSDGMARVQRSGKLFDCLLAVAGKIESAQTGAFYFGVWKE